MQYLGVLKTIGDRLLHKMQREVNVYECYELHAADIGTI